MGMLVYRDWVTICLDVSKDKPSTMESVMLYPGACDVNSLKTELHVTMARK